MTQLYSILISTNSSPNVDKSYCVQLKAGKGGSGAAVAGDCQRDCGLSAQILIVTIMEGKLSRVLRWRVYIKSTPDSWEEIMPSETDVAPKAISGTGWMD